MTTCHDIEPQLSLLVDGQLSTEAEADVRAHVRGCAACRGLLSDLERLRQSARQLGPIAPPQHVWLEVAGQIRLDGVQGHGRSAGDSGVGAVRQWIGLAAALLMITTVLYVVQRFDAPSQLQDGNAVASDTVEGSDAVADEVKMATAPAEKVIADLQAMAEKNSGAMDDTVATVFRENLGKIDLTIVESREALSTHPESESARDSLFEALRRKISVLQTMVSLINEMRLGDQEGAARAAEGLGKKS